MPHPPATHWNHRPFAARPSIEYPFLLFPNLSGGSPPAAFSSPSYPLTNVRTWCTLRMRGSDDRSDHPDTAAARLTYLDTGRRLSGFRIFVSPMSDGEVVLWRGEGDGASVTGWRRSSIWNRSLCHTRIAPRTLFASVGSPDPRPLRRGPSNIGCEAPFASVMANGHAPCRRLA